MLTITVPLEKKRGPHRIPISIQAEPESIPAETQTEPACRPGEGGMPEQSRRSGESDSPGGAN
jgi:hypothetical protein